MTATLKSLTPAPGHALIRRVERGKTAAGLVVPGEEGFALYMVEASAGHVHGGHFVACTIPAGALIYGAAGGDNPLHYHGMPREHYFMRLMDIVGWAIEEQSSALVSAAAH